MFTRHFPGSWILFALMVLLALLVSGFLTEFAGRAAPAPEAAPPQQQVGLPLQMRLKLVTTVVDKFVGDDYPPNVSLGQVLDRIGTLYDLVLDVDERAFQKAKGEEDFDVLREPLADRKPLPNLYKVPLEVILKKLLSRIQLPKDERATYVVQGHIITLTTTSEAAKTSPEERALAQPVAKFLGKNFPPDVNLGDILNHLQADYGVSFIIDDPAFRKVSRDKSFNLLRQPLAEQSPLPTLYLVDVAAVLEAALNRIVLPNDERVTYVFRRNHVLITTATEAAKHSTSQPHRNSQQGVMP